MVRVLFPRVTLAQGEFRFQIRSVVQRSRVGVIFEVGIAIFEKFKVIFEV